MPNDGWIGGVCAGLAEYFNCDVTIIRIIVCVLFFGYGVGLIPYLLIWWLAPSK